jgi:hypothetical protein
VGFLNPTRQIPGQFFKLGHDRFLSNSFPFIIHYHTLIRRYTACLKESLNKLKPETTKSNEYEAHDDTDCAHTLRAVSHAAIQSKFHIALTSCVYKVFQEERSIFWKVIVSAILRKKVYMSMCPIPNGFWYLECSILNLARNIFLPSRRNAPLYEACESVWSVSWLLWVLLSGPVILEDCMKGQNYLECLRNVLPEQLEQWYSTWGTRRHLSGYVKLKKYIIIIYLLFNSLILIFLI